MESILSYVFFFALAAYIAYAKVPAVKEAVNKIIKK